MSNRRTTIAAAFAAATLGVTGLSALAAPANAATAPTPKAAACDATPWQGAVQGAPHFAAGDRSGDYLWHDSHGFHLRVTHGSTHDRRIYSGEITASAPMRIDPVKLEKGDVAKLSANHRTLVFVFSNYGYVDGVNFHTDCASALKVANLHVGNKNLGRGEVYLGKAKAHPKAIPFTVHRRPTTAS